MPITQSAKKAVRSSSRKQVFNLRRKRAMKDITKQIMNMLKSGDVAGAEALVPNAYKSYDKAAKMNTIKANTASRKKSRIVAAIKREKAKQA